MPSRRQRQSKNRKNQRQSKKQRRNRKQMRGGKLNEEESNELIEIVDSLFNIPNFTISLNIFYININHLTICSIHPPFHLKNSLL